MVPLQVYEPINNKNMNSVCRRISILFVELTMLKDGIKKECDNIGNGFDEVTSGEIENIIYGKEVNEKYEDNVLYIQDNYEQIASGLAIVEKEMIDKYFLSYALLYYENYGSPEDFKEASTSINSFEGIEPIFMDNEEFKAKYVDENEVILEEASSTYATTSSPVATVRVFADPSSSTIGSSGLSIDVGTHAFITVSNISTSNITVGKFSISPGKTMSLGTWGNKSEHTGLWYNLESYFIKNNSAYGNRVSLRVDIDSSNLSTLNTHMVGYDKWSATNNCSSFAVTSCNKVSSTKLSARVLNTPKNLANSIKGVSSNSPILSNVYK